MFKNKLLTGVSLALLSIAAPSIAWAEDCTGQTSIGPLGGGDCTIDEDTTGALLIEDTGTLTIDTSANVTINHTIDSTTNISFGTITTNGDGFETIQNAAIGGTNPLDVINISGTDTWTANANITTDNNGGDINLADGLAGGTLNLNNGLTYTGEIDADTTDTVNIGADLAGTTITGVGAIQGATVNLLSGTFVAQTQLGSIVPITALNIADGTTMDLQGGAAISGALDLDGTVYIGSTGTVTADTYTGNDGDAANIRVGISQAGASVITGGIQIASGGPVDYSGDTLSFLIELGSEVIGDGTTTVTDFFVGNGGATLMPTVVDDSFLYDFSVAQDGSNNLDLTITRQDLGQATTTATNLLSAQVLLDELDVIDDATIEAIQFNLANASSSEEFNELLESTQPSLDQASFSVASFISDSTRTMMQQRMHRQRHERKIATAAALAPKEAVVQDAAATLNRMAPAAGDATTTIPGYYPIVKQDGKYVVPNKTRELALRRYKALKTPTKRDDRALKRQNSIYTARTLSYDNKNYPYEDRPMEVWGEVFVGNGKQGRRDGIDGYKYNVAATTFGVDTSSFDRDTILGGFFTFADSEMDAGNANLTNMHMETYQLGFYGSHMLNSDHFIDGIVSIALNDLTSNRFNVGGSNYTAIGEYDGEFITIGGEYGKYWSGPYDLLLTPAFGFNYTRMDFEDYREKGAHGANLVVDSDATQRLWLGPSITASTHRAFENGVSFIPEANLSYSYNVIHDKATARAYYQAIDNDEDLTPNPVRYNGFDTQDHFVNFGFGANFATDKWNLLTHYNYQWKQDFDGHTASLKLNYNL
ncbi:MAG: hypothetical protein CL570_03780 [Alphaproteobacteria bacterium]|nr:hypothetical protein [Alphaproteobacteria bacterium]HCQ71111.1 hypothetical protein [Rhodospirillaceae bacterium]